MSDSLSSILRVHSTPDHRLAVDAPIILAVATSVDENWPLGLSAALHGLPLAVVGLGQPGWSWTTGNAGKLPLLRAALQQLHKLAPQQRAGKWVGDDGVGGVGDDDGAVRRELVELLQRSA